MEGIESYVVTGTLNALEYGKAYVEFRYFDNIPRRVRVGGYKVERTYGIYPVDIIFRLINPGEQNEYLQVLDIEFRPDLEDDFYEVNE